ncbi:MAG: hypothetical protein ACMXYC_01390 [Candidatus Woesearchaeota archaeon]
MKNNKIILNQIDADISANSTELAQIIVARLGLEPRKKGSTDAIYRVLLEFYERSKQATQYKDPKKAVMTVEEMGYYAKVSKQTMYEYLQRWLLIGMIVKISYIDNAGKVTVGYKLHGNTIEDAFQKAKSVILRHIDQTERYIVELQKKIKNEKISESMKKE